MDGEDVLEALDEWGRFGIRRFQPRDSKGFAAKPFGPGGVACSARVGGGRNSLPSTL